MPWKKVSTMEQKQQFVSLAGTNRFTVTELCLEFDIFRKTGHKWLARHAVGGMKALEEHSRAPKNVTAGLPRRSKGSDMGSFGIDIVRLEPVPAPCPLGRGQGQALN
jgi:transposase-like protein